MAGMTSAIVRRDFPRQTVDLDGSGPQ